MRALVGLVSAATLAGFSWFGWNGMQEGMSARLNTTATEELSKYQMDGVSIEFDYFDGLISGAETPERKQEVREILRGKLPMARLIFTDVEPDATDLTYPDKTKPDALQAYSDALISSEATVELTETSGTDLSFEDPPTAERELDTFVLRRAKLASQSNGDPQDLSVAFTGESPTAIHQDDSTENIRAVADLTATVHEAPADNHTTDADEDQNPQSAEVAEHLLPALADETTTSDSPLSDTASIQSLTETNSGDEVPITVRDTQSEDLTTNLKSSISPRSPFAARQLLDDKVAELPLTENSAEENSGQEKQTSPSAIELRTQSDVEPEAVDELLTNSESITTPELASTDEFPKTQRAIDADVVADEKSLNAAPQTIETVESTERSAVETEAEDVTSTPDEATEIETPAEVADSASNFASGGNERETPAEEVMTSSEASADEASTEEVQAPEPLDSGVPSDLSGTNEPVVTDNPPSSDATKPEQEGAIERNPSDSGGSIVISPALPNSESSNVGPEVEDEQDDETTQDPPSRLGSQSVDIVTPQLDTATAPEVTSDQASVPPSPDNTSSVDNDASKKNTTPKKNRKKARLGVYMTTNPNDSIVRVIDDGSAADQAGIQVGDRIVQIGKTKVNEFKDVGTAMSKQFGGDVVRIWFRRDGSLFVVDTRLQDSPQVGPSDAARLEEKTND